MRPFPSLIFGILLGALVGWLLCAAFYYKRAQWNAAMEGRGWMWLKEPLPESFWRSSAYLALIGAAVGLAIAAAKLIL